LERIRDLSATHADLQLLLRFHGGLYSAAFPDRNEREAYDNMVTSLRGANGHHCDYHVVLVLDGDEIVGGSISDYFEASNSAVIEFITIAPDRQARGIGTWLLSETEARLQRDARLRNREALFIAAEIDDPFRSARTGDAMDPFARARWWAKRGYGRLEFPYVQPPLSTSQQPVAHLALTTKPLSGTPDGTLAATAVDAFIRDYLRYGMRIEEPESSVEYSRMAAWLGTRPRVSIAPLDVYPGYDPLQQLDVEDVGAAH
jgi:GNAT superfamily N-acetyltransferase